MVLSKIGSRFAASGKYSPGNFLWGLTKNCWHSAFVSNMVQYDWFSWAAYYLFVDAFSNGTQLVANLRRERKLQFAIAAVCAFALLEKLVTIYLGSTLDWDPSCGRWFAIRSAKLAMMNYWTFFGRSACAAMLVALLGRAFACARKSHERNDYGRSVVWNALSDVFRGLRVEVNALRERYRRRLLRLDLTAR